MMADETPPLDEARLEAIRQRNNAGILMSADDDCIRAYDDRRTLLVEVYRLRAREAAAMAIVRDVANIQVPPDEACQACHSPVNHLDSCPVVRSRREFNY